VRQVLVKVGRYGHVRQFQRIRRWVKQLKPCLGRPMATVGGTDNSQDVLEFMPTVASLLRDKRSGWSWCNATDQNPLSVAA